jgi:hypothetical protein
MKTPSEKDDYSGLYIYLCCSIFLTLIFRFLHGPMGLDFWLLSLLGSPLFLIIGLVILVLGLVLFFLRSISL